MIFVVPYITLLACFYINAGPIFFGLLSTIGVDAGLRTVAIQGLIFILCLLVTFWSKHPLKVVPNLFWIFVIWAPWIFYLAIQCNFSDPYAQKKFGLILLMQFLSVLSVYVMLTSKRIEFDRYFFPVTIAISALQLLFMMFNPETFLYAGRVERLHVENINAVWVARSFAMAALCFILWKSLPFLFRVLGFLIFAAAIIPTGSRGPLLALFLVVGLVGFFAIRTSLIVRIGTFALGTILFVSVILVFPDLLRPATEYFQRGTAKAMIEESGRSKLFKVAIENFSLSPIIGVGLGNFDETYMQKTSLNGKKHVTSQETVIRKYPHNIFFEILAELGIVGLFLFLLVLQPGPWIKNFTNPYLFIFVLYFLFSLSSGDLPANSGLPLFAYIAKNFHDFKNQQKS